MLSSKIRMWALMLAMAFAGRDRAKLVENGAENEEIMINLFGTEMSLKQLMTYVWYGTLGCCILIILLCVAIITCQICCSSSGKAQFEPSEGSFEDSSSSR